MTTCEDPSGFKQEDEFMDILEERRRSSDLGHALRTFTPSPYKGAPPLSAGALNRMVLESQYLRYVTKEVAMETGESVDLVREEASGILDEMSQNLQLGFIRLLGFTLSKVFKRLFSHININREGLNRLQQAIQEFPVILMPNHRSYVDFLVLSYILFTYDLPIPVIAAGIPLMDMKMVGEILRRSGAFFIRRAIGSDKLYWAVLSEYVRTIVRTGYAPVEFYVEGLRSRTLKSLTPKLGMMHMVLEPFFKGEVYDITLVPISISYDRVLEESLLAHELLGVPKPRETTMGLLKARRVLEEDYGSMHVYFGMPLSVRQLTKGRVDRCEYNLLPRYTTSSLCRLVSCWSSEQNQLTLSFCSYTCLSICSWFLSVCPSVAGSCRSVSPCLSVSPEDIYSYFRFLLDLFSNDFIFITGRSSQDFEEACSLLRKCGAVQTSQQEVTSPEEGQRTTSFLRALLQPFIDAYQVVFRHLCLEDVEVFTERQMVPAVRSLATKLLLSGN
nr:dihydroxyacetone phosphate acyltransferase-like [Oncorhynchus nerka]